MVPHETAAPPPATTKSDDAVTPAAISEQLADFFASGGTCEIVGDQPGSGAIDHLAAIASNGDINAGDTTNHSGTFGTKPLPKIKSGPPGAAEPADARSRNRAAPGFFGRHWFELLVLVFATTGIVLLGALVLSTAPAVPGGRRKLLKSPSTPHTPSGLPPANAARLCEAAAVGKKEPLSVSAPRRGADASATATRGGRMPQPPAPGGGCLGRPQRRSRRPTRRRPFPHHACGHGRHQGWRGVLVARWRLAARRDGPRARGGEPRPTGALCLWPHHATANGVFLHRRRTLGSRWFCDASDARGAPGAIRRSTT